jgi:chromate transporter
MSVYLQLYWEFFKTGLFAVGGGMATLPFLKDIGEKTGWYTYSDLMNMLAVSESTPGPIGINMATYVGFTVGGPLGAVIATIGEVTPSIIVILIIAALLKSFRDNKYVNHAFYGLRPASTGLIAAAGLSVIATNLFHFELGLTLSAVNWKGVLLALFLWLCTNKIKQTKGWHPIVFIGISAVIGILLGM